MSEDSVWGENLTQPQLFSVRPYYTLIMFSFLTQGKTFKKKFKYDIVRNWIYIVPFSIGGNRNTCLKHKYTTYVSNIIKYISNCVASSLQNRLADLCYSGKRMFQYNEDDFHDFRFQI